MSEPWDGARETGAPNISIFFKYALTIVRQLVWN